MSKKDKNIYKKICTHYSFMLRYKLFYATDHLLASETCGYNENFKKVYFHDLQSVKHCSALPAYIIKMIITGLFLITFGIIALTVRDVEGAFILFGISAIFGCIILMMIIKGPPQVIVFSTAVSEIKVILPNKKKTQKTLKLIAEKKAAIKAKNNEEEVPSETLWTEIFNSEKKYKI